MTKAFVAKKLRLKKSLTRFKKAKNPVPPCARMKFGKIDKIILFGGGDLLAEFSISLNKKDMGIIVITSDRHAVEKISYGGKRIALKSFLRRNKIKYHISGDIRKDVFVHKHISKRTLGISLGAAWIFTGDFIDRFGGKLVNLHPANLPLYRGGASISWQIMRNDRVGCSTLHLVGDGIDDGRLIMAKRFIYPRWCRTPAEYKVFNNRVGVRVLGDFLKGIKGSKNFDVKEQNEGISVYWPRLSTEYQAFIDWSWPLKDIEAFICAFDDPYSGASTFLRGKRVRVKKASISCKDGRFHPFQAGIIYRKKKRSLYIAKDEGTLVVKELVNGRGESVLEGACIGDRLYTPIELIDQAKKFRPVYTPKGLKVQ